MWRNYVVLVLRQSRRSLSCFDVHYPFVYGAPRAVAICFNPPIIDSHKGTAVPDYANYFGFSRHFYCTGGNDFAVSIHSVDNAVIPHKIVRENVGFDKDMEKVLDQDENNEIAVTNNLAGDDDCGMADMVHEIIIENAGLDKDMEIALEQAEIRLTTDLVVEILDRLRWDEKVAFRFFMWASRQDNYKHEYRVYNQMIEILSSTKLMLKQFRIVCDVLYYMKRNDSKSVPIKVFLTIIREYGDKYLKVIKKCPIKRKHHRKLRTIAKPEIAAFNLLIDDLCECGLVKDADILFKKIRMYLELNDKTFIILILGWCRAINPKKGMEYLEEMGNMGFSPDSHTYTAVIDAFCKAGMVNKAVELFELMKLGDSGVPPPIEYTYGTMILAFAQTDRIEDCFKAVEDMRKSGCNPDVPTYKRLIEGLCLAGKVEEAYMFLEEMTKKGYPPDIVTYNCFLKVLCDNKKADEALRHYDKMLEVGCIPSVQTFNMLLEMFFAMGDPDKALYAWDEMNNRGWDRDGNTYCVMIEGLFNNNRPEDACSLLNDVVNENIKLPFVKFDVLLMHLSKIGDLRGIRCLSVHMRRCDFRGWAKRFASSQKQRVSV